MPLKLTITLLFFSFLMMSQCEEPFPAGIETTVSGTVIDETNDLPLEGRKIKILENLQNAPWQSIDSTTTDSDGYYSMTFQTSGQGVRYYVEAIQDDSLQPFSNNLRQIDSIGNFNSIDFSFFKLYPYTITISGEDLIDTPIAIRSNYTSTNSIDPLVGSNFIETRVLLISPYYNHELKFSRTFETGEIQRYVHWIEASNIYGPNELDITLTDELFETIN